jgi:DHA3 family macrolide efflux protein-like MFS transporter
MSFVPSILRNNLNFRLLFLSGVLSQLGGFITDTAVSLHLYRLTNKDAFFLGLARGVNVFSFFLGNIFGGALGVKYPKNKILIFCELIRIPITLLLLVLNNPYLIILVTASIGFFTGIFSPSKKSLSNDLVKKEEIDLAQSVNSTSMAFIHLVAPMSAAILFDKIGFDNILYLDIISYIIGTLLLAKISMALTDREPVMIDPKEATNLQLIFEGFQQTVKDPVIRSIFLNGVTSGFVVGFLISLLLPYTDGLYANGEQAYGILLSLFGCGGLLGGFLFIKLRDKINYGKIIFGTHALESILLVIWLQIDHLYLSSILFFFWGVFVFTRITSQFSFISNKRDEILHTRLFSGVELSFMLPNVFGSIFAGILIKYLPVETILLYVGFLFIGVTLVRFLTGETRELLKN